MKQLDIYDVAGYVYAQYIVGGSKFRCGAEPRLATNAFELPVSWIELTR